MTKTLNDIVIRVAERLKIVQEGCTTSSADRVTIERAVDDAYSAEKFELRLTWNTSAVPDESVNGLVIAAAALAASGTNAPDAPIHEQKYDFGVKQLRVVNRLRPDNSKPVKTVPY